MATSLCEQKVNIDFGFPCDNPPSAGLENRIVLVNYDDVDKDASTIDSTNPSIITDLVLKTGKRGYFVEQSKTSFDGTAIAFTEGTYTNGTTHTVAFVVFDKSAEAKEGINKLIQSKVIAVVEQSNAADNGKFEVLGWNTGLTLATLDKAYVTEETAGCAAITMASGLEPMMPMSMFKTDISTTRAAFESLTDEPTP